MQRNNYSAANSKESEDVDGEHGLVELIPVEQELVPHPETIESSDPVVNKIYNREFRAMSYAPQVPANSPTVLTFTDVTVVSKASKKVLLDHISGIITGGFWAIMGASGGGKTTLLSTLSLRLHPAYMEIDGEFKLNGREYDRNILKQMSAYVMQDDLLHAEFTVEETLQYAAQLRMPAGSTNEERQQRVDEVIALMGLDHCRKVIIGNTRKKGISGGERKRVSIAIELLNRPKLIFLDEPTSGLDSTTALAVCGVLKKLSESGECTVVCTIHQPQPKIFQLFDNLLLVKQGKIIYQGGRQHIEKFLSVIQHPCPPEMNLADHLLDVIAPTGDDRLVDTQWKDLPLDLALHSTTQFFGEGGSTLSWWDQFSILFQRNTRQYFRNYDLIGMNLIATIVMAVIIANGFWQDIGTDQQSIKLRIPSLFFCSVNQGVVAAFQAINSFPSERAIMLRERQAGAYGVSAYFMAKTMFEILSSFWQPILFSLIVYPGIGYQPDSSKFVIFVVFMVLDFLAAVSLACCVTCICLSVERSTVVLAVLFELCRLFGGLYASPAIMKDAPQWKFIEVFSYLEYNFLGISLNELEDLDLSCGGSKASTCVSSGEQIIQANDYSIFTIGECAAVLVCLIVGFRFLAYLGLRFITV